MAGGHYGRPGIAIARPVFYANGQQMTDTASSVLAIMGSPRRGGNTERLLDAVLDGARSAGAKTELVPLRGLRISECDGCHWCWEHAECAKSDDMLPLYQKVAESDVLVWGTPVYWYGPTALLKGFVDRLVFFNAPGTRPRIRGKAAVLVAPFEETRVAVAEPLVKMIELSCEYLELRYHEPLLVPGMARRGEVRDHPEWLERAAELGRQLSSTARH